MYAAAWGYCGTMRAGIASKIPLGRGSENVVWELLEFPEHSRNPQVKIIFIILLRLDLSFLAIILSQVFSEFQKLEQVMCLDDRWMQKQRGDIQLFSIKPGKKDYKNVNDTILIKDSVLKRAQFSLK